MGHPAEIPQEFRGHLISDRNIGQTSCHLLELHKNGGHLIF